MENLIELVAASFARHGIKSVDHNVETDAFFRPQPGSCSAERSSLVDDAPAKIQAAGSPQPALTSALPDHNYRKTLQGDPAP